MRKFLNILFGLAVLVGFGALLPINHVRVPLKWWGGAQGQIPLAVLLLFAFLSGMAYLAVIIGVNRFIGALREREETAPSGVQRKSLKLMQRAEKELARGDEARAEQTYLRATREHPGFAPPYKALGELYRARGDIERALAWYSKLLALEPADTDVGVKIAEMALARGDAFRAVKVLGEALRARPHHPRARRLLPRACAEAGKWSEAVEAQRKLAKSLPPGEREAADEKLCAYNTEYARSLAGEDGETAEKILAEVLRKNPAYLPAAVLASELKANKGEPDEAREILERAFRRRPEPFLYERLATMDAADSFERAETALAEALERIPGNNALRVARARVLLRRGMPSGALEELEKANGETGVEKLLVEAAARHELGETARAVEAIRQALEIARPTYVCSDCRHQSRHWASRCRMCGEFNTITATGS